MLSPIEHRPDTIGCEETSPSRLARFLAHICLLLVAFMAQPPFRSEAVTEPQSAGASRKEAVMLPATPAGRQFAEWLQVFNKGDANELRSFIARHFEEAALKRISAEERAVADLMLHNITRGVVPYHIDWSTDPEIT